MKRLALLVMLLLTACGSPEAATTPAARGGTGAQPTGTPPTVVVPTPTGTALPATPVATATPTVGLPTAAPAEIVTPTPLAEQPTATTAPLPKPTDADVLYAIGGSVSIDPTIHLPGNSIVKVTLQQPTDGIGYSIIDEQSFNVIPGQPISFDMAYYSTDLYFETPLHLFAELRAPGLVQRWVTREVPTASVMNDVELQITNAPESDMRHVQVTVNVPAEITMPADAEVIIRAFRADVGYTYDEPWVGAPLRLPATPGQLSVPFEYNRNAVYDSISGDLGYILHAEVRAGGELLFTSLSAPLLNNPGDAVTLQLGQPQNAGFVQGTIDLTALSPLPEGATVLVELISTSVADGPKMVILSDTLAPSGAEQVPFEFSFSPQMIQRPDLYGFIVSVQHNGQTIGYSDYLYSMPAFGEHIVIKMKAQ